MGSSDDPDSRIPLSRRLAVVGLCVYMTLLVLAAWVDPVRPAFADDVHELARRALLVFSISPGFDVFRQESALPAKDRNDCVRVRGFTATGEERSLYPADRRCRVSGLRLRVKKSRQVHELMLRQAKHHQLRFQESGSSIEAFWRDRVLARLADTYCVRGPDLVRVDVAWTVKLVDIRNGRLISGEYLLYGYDCDSQTIAQELWIPKPEDVNAFWGGDPWAG